MNNETYMLFDRLTEEWRETSLDELAQLNDDELLVCKIGEDGSVSPPFTFAEMEKKKRENIFEKNIAYQSSSPESFEKEMDSFDPEYEYKVFTHTKYKGLGASWDDKGLECKLNEYAAQGFRVKEVVSMKTKALADFLWGVVVILERRYKK